MICKHKGCKTIASFNYKGIDKRIYCSKHKLTSMENVRYKFCAHGNCRKKRKHHEIYCPDHIKQPDITLGILLLLSLKKIEM